MIPHWQADLERILLTAEEIERRVAQLADQISRDLGGVSPLVIGVLTGSVIFVADLIRRMRIDVELDFVAVSSYGKAACSSGNLSWLKDLSADPRDRHLLLVEDIVDTGLTLDRIVQCLRQRGPASLRVCVLLDKRERREVAVQLDYVGFEVPNEFLVGYGLDYAGRYRGVPAVAVLRRQVWETG